MSTDSYIKDLVRYPSGSTHTVATIAAGTDLSGIDIDPTATVGVVVMGYNNLRNNVSMSNTPGVGTSATDDGTGINELWRFRTQFQTAPKGLNTFTSLSAAANFYQTTIVNHTLAGTSRKFSEFRGAETFFTSFVCGVAESPANRDKDYSCCAPAKLWKWIKCSWLGKIVLGLFVGILTVVSGGTLAAGLLLAAGTWASSTLIWGNKRDKNKCYKYNYLRDASFTLKVTGGYGPVGKFRITLFHPSRGAIQEHLATEGTNVTFNNLQASNSGERGADIGAYGVRVTDVITGQTKYLYVFVPYEPYGSIFAIRMLSPVPVGPVLYDVSCPKAPTLENSFWIRPGASLPGSVSGYLQTCDVPDPDTCDTTEVNFFGTIDPTSRAVQWRFSTKSDCAPPGGGPAVWSSIGGWSLLAAGTIEGPTTVSATRTFINDCTGGSFKLELSSSTGIITLSTTIDISEVPTVHVPAKYTLNFPVVHLQAPTFTLISKTPILPAATPPLFTYEFDVNTTATSCSATSVSALLYRNVNLNDTFWDSTISTAFTANSSILPAVAPSLTPVQIGPGANVTTAMTFKFIFNAPAGEDLTFVIRGTNVAAPFNTTFYPEAFFIQADPTAIPPVPQHRMYVTTTTT